MIDIEIDKLTNSVEEVATGRRFETEVRRLNVVSRKMRRTHWRFDWSIEVNEPEVYQLLVLALDDKVHGLISLERRQDHVYVRLVENHPDNVGRSKPVDGLGGNLFAFAAKLAFELGHAGHVSFIAKSELVMHYEEKFGAKRVGQSCRMYFDTDASMKLVSQYFGENDGTDS